MPYASFAPLVAALTYDLAYSYCPATDSDHCCADSDYPGVNSHHPIADLGCRGTESCPLGADSYYRPTTKSHRPGYGLYRSVADYNPPVADSDYIAIDAARPATDF